MMDGPLFGASFEFFPSSQPSFAQALLDEFCRFWEQGEGIDTRAFLALHPEIADHREVVLELIYEEFLQRKKAGEPVNLEKFAKRFPGFESSICKLAHADEFLEQRAYLFDDVVWPKAGDQLLDFRLIREIGKGAFSQVYLAEQIGVGRRIALKVTLQGKDEAELLGKLDHPHIIPVYTTGFDEATGFTVVCMPYYGNVTLRNILENAFAESRIPRHAAELLPKTANDIEIEPYDKPDTIFRNGSYSDGVLHLMTQLADAIGFAHGKGIQHRDIKPTNVLVTHDGSTKVLDFNLSTDVSQANNTIGGTLPYMSPEQLLVTDMADTEALAVDERTDVFALGVLSYELLTGSHPFGPFPPKCTVKEFRALATQRMKSTATPVHEINAEVPRSFSAAIQRCLAHNPNDRFSNAGELRAALQTLVTRRARAARWLTRRMRSLLTCAALLCWLSVLCFWAWKQEPSFATRHWNQAVHHAKHQRFAEAKAKLAAFLAESKPSGQALYLQGRLHIFAKDYQAARADLYQSDALLKDGRIKANIALSYLCGAKANFALAEKYYDQSIALGFANAAVFNNLGYCRMKQKGNMHFRKNGKKLTPDECFHHAIYLDKNLAAAHYNLARWEIDKTLSRISRENYDYIPIDGFKAIEQTIKLHGKSARLYWVAARLYGCASLCNTAWIPQLKKTLQLAVQYGKPVDMIQKDKIMELVRKTSPAGAAIFAHLSNVRVEGLHPARSTPSAIVDPLANRID